MSMDVLQEKIRKKKNPALLCLDPTGQVIPPHLMEEDVTFLIMMMVGLLAI